MMKKNYFILILGLAMSFCMKYCINSTETDLSYTNSFGAFVLFLGYTGFLFHINKQALWERLKPYAKASLIFSTLFMAAMVASVQLDTGGRVDFSLWHLYIAVVILGISWTPVCAWVMWKLEEISLHNITRANGTAAVNKKYLLRIWLLLFASYIPTLLASWPGFFVYDAEAETYMVFTEKYSTYQPLTHVVLLGWILRIVYRIVHSYNAGIVVYLLLQMFVVSGCFAYMMHFIKKCGVRRWVCNVGIAFLALFPTVTMFMCCSTKDVYFSGGIVLFTTLLLENARDKGVLWKSTPKKLLFLFASLLILLFRNNGIYAFVLFALLWIAVNRVEWKKWLAMLGGVSLLFVLISGSLSLIFHANKGPIAEMFCVPMQQLARTHEEAKDSFTEEDKEIMYQLIPEVILNNYNPKLADCVKLNFLEDNFKANPAPFISLWFRKGLQHPDIYINSFLMNTYGYWYPDTVLDGYKGIWSAGRQYEESSYFAFGTEAPGEQKSLLPWLLQFYERISLEIYQQKIPVIAMLFSIGFWFWIYCFGAVYLWKRNYKMQVYSLAMIGLIFFTVLLGPIALVRYVLYFFFCAPLLIALLFDGDAMTGNRKNTLTNN